MVSPGLAPGGTSRARPHSGQGTVSPLTGLPLARGTQSPRPQIPRRRCSFPRSKPTTTSPSTTMTGVAIFPESRIISCRAAASCEISMLVYGIPLAERNSLAALQDAQVGVE